jgi:hypothetical protein
MMWLSKKQIHLSDNNLALREPNPSLQEILHKAGQPLPHGKNLPFIRAKNAEVLTNLSQIFNRFVTQDN